MKLYYIGTTQLCGEYWIVMARSPQQAFDRWRQEIVIEYEYDTYRQVRTMDDIPENFKIEELKKKMFYGEWS